MKKNSSLTRKSFVIASVGFLVVAVFLLTISVNVHASSGSEFPYNINNKYTYTDSSTGNVVVINSLYYDYLYSVKGNLIDNINTYLSNANISYDSYIVFLTDCQNVTTNLHGAQPYSKLWCAVYINPTINYGITPSNEFLDTSVTFNYTNYYRYVFYWRPATGFGYENQNAASSGTGSAVMLGTPNNRSFTPFNTTSDTLNSGNYTTNYPIISYGLDDGLLDSQGHEIVIDRVPFSLPIGAATPPLPLVTPDFGSLTAPTSVPPTYTVNNYYWTTSPSFDNSSTLSAITGVKDYIVWLADNLHGEFGVLVTNIKGLFTYIGETIQYYGGLIIDTLNNLISTLYANIESLIVPIDQKLIQIAKFFASIVALGTAPGTDEFSVPYLVDNLFMPEPEEMQEIMQANDSLHIISNLDRIVDKVWTSETSIIKTLHNVTPVKKFHIPSCIYHGKQIGNFDIEFDWFENYKTYSDTIISTFMIIAWIYWFFVSVSHIIRYGKTYDVDDTTKGVHF